MTTLDPERQKKAKEYARISRRLWLVNTLLSALYTLAWLVFGWSISLRNWLTERGSVFMNPWFLVPAFVLIFGGIYFVLDLPLSYYSGFILPHRFDQSTQSLKDWIVDQVKGMLVGGPIGLILLELLYFALRVTGISMVVVGSRWAAGFQCPAFQPCTGTDHAHLQQVCAFGRGTSGPG